MWFCDRKAIKNRLTMEISSCYRDYFLLSRLPLVIGNTSCYQDYLLLLRLPLVIQTTSSYPKHLLLLRALFVIERHFWQTWSVILCQVQSQVPRRVEFSCSCLSRGSTYFSTKDKLPISLVTFAFHQFNVYTWYFCVKSINCDFRLCWGLYRK